jgi:cation:H+ antiporter
MFAAALGIFMTGIYLWGMLEWEDRTVLRMGWDSAAVVILYLIGSFALYQLS